MSRVQIRLYKKHDLDLIALYHNPLFDLKGTVPKVLKAYFNNNHTFKIEVPKFCEKDFEIADVEFKVTIDKETKENLSMCEKGLLNSMIKNILRTYLSGLDEDVYLKKENGLKDDIKSPQDKKSKHIKKTENSHKTKPHKEPWTSPVREDTKEDEKKACAEKENAYKDHKASIVLEEQTYKEPNFFSSGYDNSYEIEDDSFDNDNQEFDLFGAVENL